MSELIGEARVRVRPDTAGFQSDVQRQLKQPLVSIGKLITGALAIKGGFDLGKELIVDAARVQKSTEVIRAEFGKAGESIIEFADKGGIALGLTEHVTEDTAARFGILFKNIGVGKQAAAEMTLNLVKLAGSIAAIRGKDPAQVLGTLPLALSGSLRGLRQLGFAFTPVQLKLEALQLGLIRTTKQALDPGARAIAIYGLVTQHLGDYQAQAAKHSADAYNIQKRLSAEWDHAKELLGTGLLPQIAKGGDELSRFIDKEQKSGELGRVFNEVLHDSKQAITDVVGGIKLAKTGFDGFATVVGSGHNAIKILSEAFLLLYTRSKLVKWGILEAGETAVGDKAALAAPKVGRLSGALGRLKGIGPIVIPIALSFVPPSKSGQDALDKAHLGFLGHLPFIGTTEEQIAKLGQDFHDKVFGKDSGVLGLDPTRKKTGAGGLTPAQAILKQTFDEAKLLNPNLTPAMFKLEQQIARATPGVKKAGHDLGTGISDAIAAAVKKRTTENVARASADTALTALKSAAAAANSIAAQQLADARFQVDQARQTLAQAIVDSKKAVADSIQQAKQNLSSIAASLAGFGGGASVGPSAGIDLKTLLQNVAGKDASGASLSAKRLQSQLQSGAGGAGGLDRKLADLADLFNKGAISGKQADLRLDRILKSAGVNAAIIQRTQGVAAADQFRADVAGFKAQVAASTAGPQAKGKTGFELAIVKPLEVLHQQQRIIAQDEHAVGTAQLTVQKEILAQARQEAAQRKREAALIAKVAANLPSKHETAQFEALLKRQARQDPKGAADARAGARRGR